MTTEEDRERWFGGIDARMLIAVETQWLAHIRSTVLYRYVMPEQTLALSDATAGRWVSREPVTPLRVKPEDDLKLQLDVVREP